MMAMKPSVNETEGLNLIKKEARNGPKTIIHQLPKILKTTASIKLRIKNIQYLIALI